MDLSCDLVLEHSRCVAHRSNPDVERKYFIGYTLRVPNFVTGHDDFVATPTGADAPLESLVAVAASTASARHYGVFDVVVPSCMGVTVGDRGRAGQGKIADHPSGHHPHKHSQPLHGSTSNASTTPD